MNAPPHSITSSARASSMGGTSRPSALAVLKLIPNLVLGRRLHRQIGWLRTLEDAIDIVGRAPVLVGHISPIGHQAASGDEFPGRSLPEVSGVLATIVFNFNCALGPLGHTAAEDAVGLEGKMACCTQDPETSADRNILKLPRRTIAMAMCLPAAPQSRCHCPL